MKRLLIPGLCALAVLLILVLAGTAYAGSFQRTVKLELTPTGSAIYTNIVGENNYLANVRVFYPLAVTATITVEVIRGPITNQLLAGADGEISAGQSLWFLPEWEVFGQRTSGYTDIWRVASSSTNAATVYIQFAADRE